MARIVSGVACRWLGSGRGRGFLRRPPRASRRLGALVEQVESEDYFGHLGVTLARVGAAFVLAMAIGSAIGLALGTSRVIDRLFSGWLIMLLNLPALVVIVLCYVWFGLTEAAAVGAVAINKIPNVAATLRERGRALSRDLAEMARVYGLSWWGHLRHLVLPQLAPFFAVAARNGLALVWKIVLVVELLGRRTESVSRSMSTSSFSTSPRSSPIRWAASSSSRP